MLSKNWLFFSSSKLQNKFTLFQILSTCQFLNFVPQKSCPDVKIGFSSTNMEAKISYYGTQFQPGDTKGHESVQL